MIPDETVERVRNEADVVAIIGDFVQLKRHGASFRGPCPFHQGKHDNFAVTPGGGYVCFVCGEKGDVFTFVQKKLGLNFVESVKWVGEKAGVDVQEVSKRADGPDPREPLWEVNATAAAYFTEQLWDSPGGSTAREYLGSRGIDRPAADRFGIGFSPVDAAALRQYLSTLGFDDARQLEAGLLRTTDDRPEPRVRFRGRLMFPIPIVSGQIAGFGGRIIGAGEPKYLNSAESSIFAKRELLYGLSWAKGPIRRADRIIVVEGYFDAIRIALAGVEEVVAPLGTALTDEQAKLIKKYTNTVYLVYDSDRAGLKATFRSGDVLLAHGLSVRVATLPPGDDPDTYAAKFGQDGIERLLDDSIDVFDRRVQILERGGFFADLRRKQEALDKLLPTIRLTSDPMARDLYLGRVSEVSGASRSVLERELATLSAAPQRAANDQSAPKPRDVRQTGERRVVPRTRSADVWREGELLRALLHLRRYVETVAEKVGPDAFADERHERIFEALVAADIDATPEDLAATLDPASIERMQELLEEPGGLERADELVAGGVNALVAREKRLRLAEIDRAIPLASTEGKDDLIREKEWVVKELSALNQPVWGGFNSPRS